MSDTNDNLRLEIRHVLFIDIVGYSKLLIEEQKERLSQLTQIALATGQVRDCTDEQLVGCQLATEWNSSFVKARVTGAVPLEIAEVPSETPGTSRPHGDSQRPGQ